MCASEQAVIVDKVISKEFEKFMKENKCYFLNEEETKKLEKTAIDEIKCAMNPDVVGQAPYKIAKMAGFEVAEDTKILIAKLNGVGPKYPLSREKLSPILAYYIVDGWEQE